MNQYRENIRHAVLDLLEVLDGLVDSFVPRKVNTLLGIQLDVTSGVSKQQMVLANVKAMLEVIDVSLHVSNGHVTNEGEEPRSGADGRPYDTVSTKKKSSMIDHPRHIAFEQTYGNFLPLGSTVSFINGAVDAFSSDISGFLVFLCSNVDSDITLDSHPDSPHNFIPYVPLNPIDGSKSMIQLRSKSSFITVKNPLFMANNEKEPKEGVFLGKLFSHFPL